MNVLSLKRFFFSAAILLAAHGAFAAYPSVRTGPRIAFDESTGYTVLFGGSGGVDTYGTGLGVDVAETWIWTGSRWLQRFPTTNPPGRYDHTLVYDAARRNVVMFGGRNAKGVASDTWIFADGDWRQLETATTPPPRYLAGSTFDRKSSRMLVFGGTRISDDGKSLVEMYDLWAFDGTNWTRLIETGPEVHWPLLTYDEAHDQLILVGVDVEAKTLMYIYDRAANEWKKQTPETLPLCANQAVMTYRRADGDVFLTGGVCTTTTSTEDQWVWDGTNWSMVEVTSKITKATDQGIAYDSMRNEVVLYGGTYGSSRSTTYLFRANDWVMGALEDNVTPGPRSRSSMLTDPVRNVVWMFGGLSDVGVYYSDLWKYENGSWIQANIGVDAPSCSGAVAALDTDRSKIITVCPDGATWEFDIETSKWAEAKDNKEQPRFRNFSSMVYDSTLKKTVLFGGWDNERYRDETLLWDGKDWSEVKKNRAPARHLTSMWYDPVAKKTFLYGGIGRRDPDAKTERYGDMWSLDSNGWTEVKPSVSPGIRYGAQIATDRRAGKTVLFGGLKVETGSDSIAHQVYANDTWEWDGSTWRQIATTAAPSARENAAMAFDPSMNQIVLFGGWAGYYLSDIWTYENGVWTAAEETLQRRRAVRR